ncbi:F-box only protein 16 [Parambassis ranga]|uniref:F-box only protein 16 n=1 Tax=Parambassis ranga TaxID=210632 RepID=A0A6P7HDX2_9TELE|nr:F-box only protein 16 [Parambassis ranga]
MPLATTAKTQTKLSAWTPLNNSLINSKVFEERRSLLKKWVDRWSDSQRKAVLQDFVLVCSVEQLRFLSLCVSRQLPLEAADFTCLLPRALCLYLFSFLDPRSLCRCAQVSWHWKNIVELDQLWMRKCLRLDWCINMSPTPYEQGAWKRLYIQRVQELRLSSLEQMLVPDVAAISGGHEELSEPVISEECPASNIQHSKSRNGKQPATPPPWRGSDRHPKDTLRFNYLDNLGSIEQAQRVQMKSRASTCYTNPSKPDTDKRKTLSEAHYKLRKAKSLMFLGSNCKTQHSPPPPPPLSPHPAPPQQHPQHLTQTTSPWASQTQDYPITMEAARSLLHHAQWNAGICPKPVRTAVPHLSLEALRASQHSHRNVPSTPLFKVQPWTASHIYKARAEVMSPPQGQ